LFIFSENRRPVPKEQVESCINDLEINIIKKIESGNINAFEDIVNKYKDKAMTLAMRILKNTEDAEDALQEAFVKTFRAIADKQFEERAKFSTYFYKIVYNTSLDFYKKHKAKSYNILNIDSVKRSDEGELTDIAQFEMEIDRNKYYSSRVFDPDRKALDSEIQGIINKYLDEIPEKYSTILTLFYINELSHAEIAETLRLPVGTVKNRIFRAKDKLKELLTKEYAADELMELS
jgi:RNA polymerase sigma-70 factor (ECF subfamily)